MPLLLTPTRRGFLAGMASLLAAPAIVRASSLMQIVVPTQWIEPGLYSLEFDTSLLVKATERYAFGFADWRAAAFLTAFDPNGNHEMLITERMKLPTRNAALEGTKMPAVCALDTDAPIIRDFLGAEMRLPALPLARPVPPDSMNTTHIERGVSRYGGS